MAKSAIPDRQLFRGGFKEVIITSGITTGQYFRGEAGGFAILSGLRDGGFAPSYGRLRVVKSLILW